MKNKNIKNLILSAMFIAIGIVLPFLTGQIKNIGNMLLPMHIPVLLCGLICGSYYGLAAGFIMPLLRSVLFGMPKLYPSAVAMAFELAAYGFVLGILYAHTKKKNVVSLLLCMLAAMVSGRIIWGAVEVILLGLEGSGFTFSMFIAGAILNSIPGIILQIILIPTIMVTLGRAKLIDFPDR